MPEASARSMGWRSCRYRPSRSVSRPRTTALGEGLALVGRGIALRKVVDGVGGVDGGEGALGDVELRFPENGVEGEDDRTGAELRGARGEGVDGGRDRGRLERRWCCARVDRLVL